MTKKEIQPEDVSKLTVKPFENESCRSHLTFTINGKDYTWSMSNHILLTIIENNLDTLQWCNESKKYERILNSL